MTAGLDVFRRKLLPIMALHSLAALPPLPPEMGWMPLSPDGIAMCHTRGVEAQAEGEGIHGRS